MTNVNTKRGGGEGVGRKTLREKAISPFLAYVAGETDACYAGYPFLLLVFCFREIAQSLIDWDFNNI